jgi:predicted Zn-ribbon and HTH transcriptional regulator
MALPQIDLPIYDLKIPSTGQEIKIRPFKVKEEKLLLMAAESNDNMEIINTTKQVLNNCILTEGVDIEKLPFFDVDFLFIAIRAKSIGETIELEFTCNAVKDEKKCGHVFSDNLDLTKCRVIKNDKIEKNINLGGGLAMKMKYPSYTVMKFMDDGEQVLDRKVKIIAACIEMIQKGDDVYTTKDFTFEELKNFIEELSEAQYIKLEEFVDNFPYFVVDIETQCPKCKTKHRKEYRDFSAFF